MHIPHVLFSVCITLSACATLLIQTPVGKIPDQTQLLVLPSQDPERPIPTNKARGDVVTSVDTLSELGDTLVHFRIAEGRTIKQAIAETETLIPRMTAGANHACHVRATADDTEFATDAIGGPTAGCKTLRQINIIDAVVRNRHPALLAEQLKQMICHGSDAPPNTDHGSTTTSFFVGEGRLREGTLFSANAISPDGTARNLAGVDAILRSVNGLRARAVDLTNTSLADPFTKLLKRGLGNAAADGTLFVAAADNLGPSALPQFSTAFPFVIAVAAIDRDKAPDRLAARGDPIGLTGPGVDVPVTSQDRSTVFSGISVATPSVSAIIAADAALKSARSRNQALAHLSLQAVDLALRARHNLWWRTGTIYNSM